LRLALRDIETRKSAGELSLKSYLQKKKAAQQALYDFEARHEGKKYKL
jgi:hypothetical protein